MRVESGCALLDKSKELARKKGLNPNEIRCSMGTSCDGLGCLFIPNTLNLEPPTFVGMLLRRQSRIITSTGK
jgi:hypothetical protein